MIDVICLKSFIKSPPFLCHKVDDGSIFVRIGSVNNMGDSDGITENNGQHHRPSESFVWHKNTSHKSYSTCKDAHEKDNHYNWKKNGNDWYFNPLESFPAQCTVWRSFESKLQSCSKPNDGAKWQRKYHYNIVYHDMPPSHKINRAIKNTNNIIHYKRSRYWRDNKGSKIIWSPSFLGISHYKSTKTAAKPKKTGKWWENHGSEDKNHD